jgi:hypothetical protein
MPGGWHFPQHLSSGQTVKITAFDFPELLANILEFRMRHMDLCGAENARIESVRADLKNYICAHFPQNCADSQETPFVGWIGIQSDYKRPIDRSGQWLADVANERLEYADPALAAQRAQICAQCPQNVRWQTGCASCNDNVAVRVQNLKGSMRTPYDRNLQMCRTYGHVNEVAVWLLDTHSQPEKPPPPNCWKA